MLILIHGSLGLDYLIHNVLPSGDWLMTMICPGGNGEVGIDVELSPGVVARIAAVWGRVLGLVGDDLRLLLDSLMNSSRLSEAVNYIIETYMDYNASRLYYFARLMSMLNVWRPIGKGCIDTPLIEPIRTLIATVLLAYQASGGVKGSVILSTDFVDDVKDLLLEVRGLGNIYVFTSHMPRDVGIFDELFITSTSIPQETFGRLIRMSNGSASDVIMVRLGLGVVSNDFALNRESLSDVDLEILRTVNELGFTTMASLIDMITQSAAVTRNDVIKELIKLSNMNLVKIRYLSDGRAIVTPTVAGLKLLMAK